MKKLLFSLSLLASLVTFAGESTVEATAQVFGVLPIYSTASNVIVSVPWVAASNTDTNSISVAEVVKTAGLTEGDWIRSWDSANNRFNVWTLTLNSSGVLEWQASKVVSATGTVDESNDSTATYLKRGDALILYRQFPTNFYVYGQYKALTASDTTQVLQGYEDAPAYTLIAPPMTSGTDGKINLNTDVTWDGVREKGDHLFYGESSSMGKTWQYNATKNLWGFKSNVNQDGWDSTTKWVSPVVPVGVGLWYKSVGGNPTIHWVK